MKIKSKLKELLTWLPPFSLLYILYQHYLVREWIKQYLKK